MAAGFDFPPLASRFKVFQVLQGVKRFVAKERKPKIALTFGVLSELFHHLVSPWTNGFQCALWACFLVAYYGMFRKDNVAVRKETAFNPNVCLIWGDLKVGTDAQGRRVLWVRVRRSKTNQFQDRVHYVALVEVPGSFMCPVTWWERHTRLNPADEFDPAFCFSKEKKPMTHLLMVKYLKQLLTAAGYDADLFSGHSFRRGGATDALVPLGPAARPDPAAGRLAVHGVPPLQRDGRRLQAAASLLGGVRGRERAAALEASSLTDLGGLGSAVRASSARAALGFVVPGYIQFCP